MKRNLSYASSALLAIMFSCSVEEPVSPVSGGEEVEGKSAFEIFVSSGTDDTKTTVDPDTWSVTWDSDDSLSVLIGKKLDGASPFDYEYHIFAKNPDNAHGFVCETFVPEEGAIYQYNVLYPVITQGEWTGFNGGMADNCAIPIGTVKDVPLVQTGINDASHIVSSMKGRPAANVNGTAKPEITMQHVTSMLKVVVQNDFAEPLTVTRLYLNNFNILNKQAFPMSGELKVYFNKDAVAKYTDQTLSTSIALDVNDGVIPAGEQGEFYLAIPPVNMAEGSIIRLDMTTDKGGFVKLIERDEYGADLTFAAGKVNTVNMTCAEGDRSFYVEYGAEAPIEVTGYDSEFADGKGKIFLNGPHVPEFFMMDNTDVISLNIPSNVESVGPQAFFGCKNLSALTFGEQGSRLRFVEYKAFQGCTSISGSIRIPSEVVYIAYSSFFTNYVGNIDLYLLGQNPPKTSGTNSFNFKFINNVYVPAASLDAYKSHYSWNKPDILPKFAPIAE